MNIGITRMDVSHLSEVFDIQVSSYPASLHESKELFSKIITSPNSLCYIARQGSEIIGYILGYPTLDSRTDFERGFVDTQGQCNCVYLHDLCIMPQKRALKVGWTLFSFFAEEVEAIGYNKIRGLSTAPSLSFWEKLGFIKESDYLYHGNTLYKVCKLI